MAWKASDRRFLDLSHLSHVDFLPYFSVYARTSRTLSQPVTACHTVRAERNRWCWCCVPFFYLLGRWLSLSSWPKSMMDWSNMVADVAANLIHFRIWCFCNPMASEGSNHLPSRCGRGSKCLEMGTSIKTLSWGEESIAEMPGRIIYEYTHIYAYTIIYHTNYTVIYIYE